MGNREKLLLRIRGGIDRASFIDLECLVNEAGQIDFKKAREIYAGGCDDDFIIHISKPGNEMEIRMGSAPGDEVPIIFSGEAPCMIESAKILESFQLWKASPGVSVKTRDYGNRVEKIYRPSSEAIEINKAESV